MRDFLDGVDAFFGHDRRGVRALLLALAIVPSLLLAEWAINSVLFPGPDCDAECQAITERLRELIDATPEPFDPAKFIDDTLNDSSFIGIPPSPTQADSAPLSGHPSLAGAGRPTTAFLRPARP